MYQKKNHVVSGKHEDINYAKLHCARVGENLTQQITRELFSEGLAQLCTLQSCHFDIKSFALRPLRPLHGRNNGKGLHVRPLHGRSNKKGPHVSMY
jgi:hypothetical protein